MILKKKNSTGVLAEDLARNNSCNSSHISGIFIAARSFKKLLQDYLLNHTVQLNCNGDTIDYLTDLQIYLTIIANIQQYIEVRN